MIGPPPILGLAEEMVALAQRNLERDGSLMPVAFVVHGTGDLAVFGLSFRSDAAKDAAFALVRRAARGGQAVVVITEGWAVAVRPEQVHLVTRPSQHPDRQEVLVVEIADASGLRECWQVPFVRDGGGRVRWGPRLRTTEFHSRHLDGLFHTDA